MRGGQGQMEQGESVPAFKTPHEGQYFIKLGHRIKLQLVSLGPSGEVPESSVTSSLGGAAALTCSTPTGS